MENPRKFKVGLVQMAITNDPKENLHRAIDHVEQAARGGAEIVCLPELFMSRYFCQREDYAAFDLAETIPGPTTEAIGSTARHLGVAVITPIFERRAVGLYHNSAAIIDADGKIAGLYRKMHIPDDPAYYEKYYFTPGDLGFRTIDTSKGRVGTLICWDQWYPEAARLTALGGASVLFYPTAIGWHPGEKEKHGAAQRDAWRTVQRGHAIANGIYVVAVNRVGFEPISRSDDPENSVVKHGIEFWGSSFICDPFGVVIAEASVESEEILVAEVSLDRMEVVRRNWPFLRDRRVDAYHGIEERQLDGDRWRDKT